MADVGAQDALLRGVSQPIDDPLGVAPGDPDHGREAQAPRFVGKNPDDLPELVELDRVEFAVAVGGIDAVHAGRVQAADVFAENIFVKAIAGIKWRGDGGPDAMQVVARQPLVHRVGHRPDGCRSWMARGASRPARRSVTWRTYAKLAPVSGCMGSGGSPTASPRAARAALTTAMMWALGSSRGYGPNSSRTNSVSADHRRRAASKSPACTLLKISTQSRGNTIGAPEIHPSTPAHSASNAQASWPMKTAQRAPTRSFRSRARLGSRWEILAADSTPSSASLTIVSRLSRTPVVSGWYIMIGLVTASRTRRKWSATSCSSGCISHGTRIMKPSAPSASAHRLRRMVSRVE